MSTGQTLFPQSIPQGSSIPLVLTIAASDPSGAAGVQADLKTFEARQVYGMSAITAVTVQDSKQVRAVKILEAEFIGQQIATLLADFLLGAIKTGMLLNSEVISAVNANITSNFQNLIVDPVLVNGAGIRMTDDATIEAYKKQLFPRALVITPNLDEAAILAGYDLEKITSDVVMRDVAKTLHTLGPRYVLVKGGHMHNPNMLLDLLYDGSTFYEFSAPRLPVDNPRGVGCTLASCIAAEVAKGQPLAEAVRIARNFITDALKGALGWQIGQGTRGILFHSVGRPAIGS